jgi:EpsI family protein
LVFHNEQFSQGQHLSGIIPTVSAGTPLASRRELLIGGALVGTAVLASALKTQVNSPPQGVAGRLDQLVPERIGDWTHAPQADVLMPTGENPNKDTYDDLLTRYYVSQDAEPVMLLIAYGTAQTGTTQLHRPEVCYPAAGFNVSKRRDLSLASLNAREFRARQMTATAPGRIEQIVYWSRVGREFPTDSVSQRMAVLRSALAGAVADGVLVRLSMIHSEPQIATIHLAAFARLLVQASSLALRRLLLG